jgi:transcriptional regulator with XRE-family HTH domain
MATKPRSVRWHLHIDEWMAFRGLSDEDVAEKLGVARETVWRWSNEQHRLNPDKMAKLAAVLDITAPQLYYPPGRRSIDAILTGADKETHDAAVDIVARLVLRQ